MYVSAAATQSLMQAKQDTPTTFARIALQNDAYLPSIKLSNDTFCQQKSGSELCLSMAASTTVQCFTERGGSRGSFKQQ